MKYKHEDGTPFTKEEFLQKLKTDKEFNDEFGSKGIDQIANSINLLKTDPDSRRNKVNAWNVGELDQMVLPPCHYGFQVYTRELKKLERINIAIEKKLTHETAHLTKDFDYQKWCDENNIPTRAISLMWNQRSVDTFLGLPFNIASYGLLLEIIAKEVNMVPDELIGNLGDTHLYSNHIEQAKEQIGRPYTPEERHELLKEAMGDLYTTAVNEQMPFGGGLSEYYELHKIPKRTREPYPLPKVNILLHFNNEPSFVPEHWLVDDFVLENYQSHPSIKAPLSN